MASWREIDRVRKDPTAMRALAVYLLRLPNAELTEWEIKFLRSISEDRTSEEFTTRQAEKLMQIRDDSEEVSEIGYQRLSVRILIEDCKIAYLDLVALDEDNAEWIKAIRVGTTKIKRKYIAGYCAALACLTMSTTRTPRKI
jgi:hypothetical protein